MSSTHRLAVPLIKEHVPFAEMDPGFQQYGFAADLPMDGLDGTMMHDEYPGSMAYDRQYHDGF